VEIDVSGQRSCSAAAISCPLNPFFKNLAVFGYCRAPRLDGELAGNICRRLRRWVFGSFRRTTVHQRRCRGRWKRFAGGPRAMQPLCTVG
jgi:hypothetical protein